MSAIKPDYLVLGASTLQPTPETTEQDTQRFIAAVERITGVAVKRVGEISTTGPYAGGENDGPVVMRGGIYRFLPDYAEDDWPGAEDDYADLPDDWFERAWDEATL